MLQISEQNFKSEVEESELPVLVDFYADWCGPCKMMGPIIEELANELKDQPIKIGKMNIDDNQEIVARYNIMSIPTVMIFKKGQIADQFVGFRDKETIIGMIKKNI